MTKMREIDWLELHGNSIMKFYLLLPLENVDFLASRCFPNVKDIACDPSKECWTSLSAKSSSDMQKLTAKLSSTSQLFWFCGNLYSVGNYFIYRNRDCNLIRHLIHPIFPNLAILFLERVTLDQIPYVLTEIFESYSNTLQELQISNRQHEVASQSKSEKWCLDVSITGLPDSFLNILRENIKNVNVSAVQLQETRSSIQSMKCKCEIRFFCQFQYSFVSIRCRFTKTFVPCFRS